MIEHSSIRMTRKNSENVKIKRNLILLILIILMLTAFALFQILSIPTSYFGTLNCIPKGGYACLNSIYINSTANIEVILSQNSGFTWTTANFVFVPQGTYFSNNIPSISFTTYPANTLYGASQLVSGQAVAFYLPVYGVSPPVKVGTSATGTIWVQYTTTRN